MFVSTWWLLIPTISIVKSALDQMRTYWPLVTTEDVLIWHSHSAYVTNRIIPVCIECTDILVDQVFSLGGHD